MRLGFTGQAGSGKDTAAKMAHELMPDHPIYSLAAPIKDVFDEAFGWGYCHRDGRLKETRLEEFFCNPMEFVRVTMKHYGVSRERAVAAVEKFFEIIQIHNVYVTKYNEGTYKVENLSPRVAYQIWGSDVWRDLGGETFWTAMAPENCIIADVRFDNEALLCDQLVQIKGKNQRNNNVNAHVSEAGINVPAFPIQNHGTLDELRDKVYSFLYSYCIDGE